MKTVYPTIVPYSEPPSPPYRKGSVVCNFKVNYVLKEGFVAVPFHVNGTNITEALGEGFEYKQGILFQRFVIAAGSFKSASE